MTTVPNWAIPGAQVFLNRPTTAQETAAAMAARRQTALGSAEQVRAQRDREIAVLHARHAWLLARATDPILKALVDAHGPAGDQRWPTCAACPEVSDDYGSEPEGWPCGVWMFVSDRMGDT